MIAAGGAMTVGLGAKQDIDGSPAVAHDLRNAGNRGLDLRRNGCRP